VAGNSEFAPESEGPIVWNIRNSRQLVPYASELTPSAAVHLTNPVCSLDNSTIFSTVWWADGRQLVSVLCASFSFCNRTGWLEGRRLILLSLQLIAI
jgi:hypothetical protein